MAGDEELDALRARLERYTTDRDPEVLLHPAVLADVLALSAVLHGRLLEEPAATAVLGAVHWQRYLLLPEPDDQDDLRAALAIFSELAPSRPDLVPKEVAGFLGSDPDAASENPSGKESHWLEPTVESEPAFAVELGPLDQMEQVAATLRMSEPGDSGQPGSAELLADAVTGLARYLRSGQPLELDKSVALVYSVVSDLDADEDVRSAAIDMLAGLLLVRYQLYGQLKDLNTAIARSREASHSGVGLKLAGRLSNLGLALRARFERTGRDGDLAESIELHRRAVELTPVGDPLSGRYLSNLGLALRLRFERGGDQADVDDAIAVTRRAVAASSPGDPELYRHLTNLGVALRERHESQGASEDIEEAIQSGRAALALLPHEHPDRAGVLLNLGGSLLTATEGTTNDRQPSEAIEVLQQAVRHAARMPALRALAATHLGRAAARLHDWRLASDSFETAITAIDQIVRHSHRSDSEFHLARFAGVASDAAASALQTGDPERAAELWEYGHGVLIRQALDQRSATESGLADVAPNLARRLVELRRPDAGGRMSALPQEWAQLVEQIRAIPGFEHFLRPISARELTAAAAEGPIVLVNVSAYRSDAIVLTAGGIKIIRLPGLDPEDVRLRHHTFNHAAMLHSDWEVGELLDWLWDTIAGPILDELGFQSRPFADQQWPRLWWCPSGPLAFLPLHMAGHHDRRETVLDRVVSSYTPTVRALIDARRRSPRPLADPRVLAVGLTEAAGSSPLFNAAREARDLAQRFPGSSTVLTDSQATADAVLNALPTSDWVHFACHGTADTVDPSESGLLLSDRRLTIRDLADSNLNGQLVFLAACKTAVGEVLPDESVNLASAFLLAGYRNALGSLWPILDNFAPEVADAFYSALTTGADNPAHALHLALQVMRERHPDRPMVWASMIHVGP